MLKSMMTAAILGVAAMTAVPVAVQAEDLTGKTVKFGAIVPASGPFAEWGRANTVALKMLEKQVNEAGGINGAKMEIVIYDDGAKPAQAVSMLRKLADDDQVLAVAGPATSSAVEVAFPVANQLGIVSVSQNSSKPGVAAANRPWGFRNTVDEAKLARLVVPFFAKTFDVKKAAIIYDAKDATASAAGAKIFPQILADNGIENLDADTPISFNTGDLDVSAQVTKLRSLQPDAVVLSADYSQAITVLREMKRQGMKTPVVGSTQLMSSAILAAYPELPIVAPTTFFAGLDVPAVKTFTDGVTPLMRAEKNLPGTIEPSLFDANIYEIVSLFAQAAKEAGVTAAPADLAADRTRIRDYMASESDFVGLGGKVRFAADGDAVKSFFIVQAKDGKWTSLETACSSPEADACAQ
ncbi:ABC transporter substrate-binding protein [Paenirhodobacter populi]|uniref:ABC transporter substrate-binding protein n=1 Tax=Paenirhodobacter populi TaxID=2306993 RepID=A0A443IMR6_9RHOB|nr:ABC transporter substrate-binding protein [Sinirhodobacter populi]RWR06562.1 ABC transporter substrate-binding protein [Sinirhodobacter populi]RWR19591.1 ABC transporter substrate-binding protein [Sinirhodobacter populi]